MIKSRLLKSGNVAHQVYVWAQNEGRMVYVGSYPDLAAAEKAHDLARRTKSARARSLLRRFDPSALESPFLDQDAVRVALKRLDSECRRPRSSGWIYVVKAAGLNRYKIGRSDTDVVLRLCGIQNMGPITLEVVAIGHCSFLEPAIHRRLSEHRLHGEWFALDDISWITASRGHECFSCALFREIETDASPRKIYAESSRSVIPFDEFDYVTVEDGILQVLDDKVWTRPLPKTTLWRARESWLTSRTGRWFLAQPASERSVDNR